MVITMRLLIIFFILLLYACNNSRKYPYAIRDFQKKLQPHLEKMVETGIVGYSNNALEQMATDEELMHLSLSEHPILRASALREMLDRKSFTDFDIVMSHLDDTALVFTDAGEFGIRESTVSDDILQLAGWKTEEARAKTIDKVLSEHNYLYSAYIILERLKPQEKYYPFIRDMAKRPKRLDRYVGYEFGLREIECANYGLAKFKKQEDVLLIKKNLLENIWELTDISFEMMKLYPDTAYFDVLHYYHNNIFYIFSTIPNRPGSKVQPNDFIQALAVQKNDNSAKLLDTMLNKLPNFSCLPAKQDIINDVILAIWDNQCPAYEKLRERIQPKAKELLKRIFSFKIDRNEEPIDTTKENYHWYL